MCASVCFIQPSLLFLVLLREAFPPNPFPLPPDARIDAQQTMFAGHFQSRDCVTHRGSTLAETHLSA